jgi:hypothetical protein
MEYEERRIPIGLRARQMAIGCDVHFEQPGQRNIEKLSLETLPFGPGDVTAGSEDELQAVVIGGADTCDLPISIRNSRFFRNIARRSASGEAPHKTLNDLQLFLDDSRDVWENSWVRLPSRKLSAHALATFHADIASDAQGESARRRADSGKFIFANQGEDWLRIPVSYVLKLALADLVGTQPYRPEVLHDQADRLLRHFSNDNTSPEVTSFHIVSTGEAQLIGRQVARESARCFLFASLLMSHANHQFGLLGNGQRAMIYHAPHPPVRQTDLSSCISDSFYRELFMSPCLSGWDDGEAKSDYMHLCHQVLSRSQLNAVAKLREAGIIANDLIVLPGLSNVSLANNGLHVSMGSETLTRKLREQNGSFAPEDEKCGGDLAIKIFEHFLPLFVGTYSAAPYRIDFAQFHPERLLAFLPHELDFTHLRLMWREWKEKANLRVFGKAVTPYGPGRLDSFVARLFRLRGDFVPDYRLLSYPVAWLSTDHSSALDGRAGNIAQLSLELDELGVLDRRLSFYMPLRLRDFGQMGFSGFEARYYSLFPSYHRDMAPAIDLQQLLLAVCVQLALTGTVPAANIPDDPTSESERRQPFFFAAAGLPAFYVHKKSRNQFLLGVLTHCKNIRSSRRHSGYLRVPISDYREALVSWMCSEVKDLLDSFAAERLIGELRERLSSQDLQASECATKGILGQSRYAKPLQHMAREFNLQAENYYRNELRRAQLREAFQDLTEDVDSLRDTEKEACHLIRHGARLQEPARFLRTIQQRLPYDDLSPPEITSLLDLLLVLITRDAQGSRELLR